MSYLDLLEGDYGDELDDQAKLYVHYAVDSSRRMRALVQDLLIYSRAGTGRATPQRVEVEGALVEALSNLEIAVQESEADVRHGPLPVVRMEHSQLVQLLQNLVGNAIKYRSEERPRIRVDAERARDGRRWKISVSDNGRGFQQRYAERVFVLFQRLHTQSQFPGTGIGLALCKRIVERHGGQIWAESAPGKGSTFHFTLPAWQEAGERAEDSGASPEAPVPSREA